MVTVLAISFKHYKTFQNFSVTLNNFNIIVGPNNAGKSTVIGSLKLLAEGLKKARLRNATPIRDLNDNLVYGYEIETRNAPIAIDNVFYNYDDSKPAIIRYTLSNDCTIQIFFPERNICLMTVEGGFRVRTAKEFKKHINLIIGFVPTLSPVEEYEQLYLIESARLALITPKASRNFRNIWYHYGEDFDLFRDLISSTWPGMDVKKPERIYLPNSTILKMYCPEQHIDRELYWAGYGFQVWCQMLTFIIKNKNATMFIVDEPDIYLHADLQRQLINILRDLGPVIVIATHSTEIINEAELNDILIINKINSKARRLKNSAQLREVFTVLGSNLNPVITQIAKTKRVLFVEGKDFIIFSKIAKLLGFKELSNRSDFAVVHVSGFNPTRLRSFKEGIEKTIGASILSAVIFDKDYRSDKEVESELFELRKGNFFAHIHTYKELENILLIPEAIEGAINQKLKEYNARTNKNIIFNENILDTLNSLSNVYKADVHSQLLSHRLDYERPSTVGEDKSKIMSEVFSHFDKNWSELATRLKIIPGKDFISVINKYLQEKYFISISLSNIIYSCTKSSLPSEIVSVMTSLDDFRRESVSAD